MPFLKLSTMQYPLFEGDVRLEHPEITECQTGDTFPCPEDFVKVKEIEYPQIDTTQNQYVIEELPQQIDGVWTQVLKVSVYTDSEIAEIKAARQKMQEQLDKFKPKTPVQDTSGAGTPPNVVA